MARGVSAPAKCADVHNQLLRCRCSQTMDRETPGISAIAECAGVQSQPLLGRSFQTMDRGFVRPSTTAGLADAHIEMLLYSSIQTLDIVAILATAGSEGAQMRLLLPKSGQIMDKAGPGI